MLEIAIAIAIAIQVIQGVCKKNTVSCTVFLGKRQTIDDLLWLRILPVFAIVLALS